MDMRIIAVLAAVIVVVAGAAVFLMKPNDSGNEYGDVKSTLMVYGNANNDFTIDAEDVSVIEDVISGSKTLADHPLADTNADGVVNAEDKALCQDIVDRKKGYVYIHCDDTNDNPTAVKVPYPLNNIVLQRTSPTTIACEIGVGASVAGYFVADPVVHSAIYEGAVNLKGSAMGISATAWQNCMDLDSSLVAAGSGIGAIITETGTTNLKPYYDEIAAAQIPLLRFATADVEDSLAYAVTLGFICGEASEKTSLNYAKISFEAMKHIKNVLSSLSDEDRQVFVAITMKRYISGTGSDYTNKCELAGGKPLGDVSSDFTVDYAGDKTVKMESTEALSKYDDHLDIVLSFTSVDYNEEGYQELVEVWGDYKKYYEMLDCYQSMVIINVYMPQVCQLAYAAACMYPEVISMEYADNLMKSLMENSGATCSFADVTPVFHYQDYVASQAA